MSAANPASKVILGEAILVLEENQKWSLEFIQAMAISQLASTGGLMK